MCSGGEDPRPIGRDGFRAVRGSRVSWLETPAASTGAEPGGWPQVSRAGGHAVGPGGCRGGVRVEGDGGQGVLLAGWHQGSNSDLVRLPPPELGHESHMGNHLAERRACACVRTHVCTCRLLFRVRVLSSCGE